MNSHGWLFGFLALTAVLGAGCAKANGGNDGNGTTNGWSSFPVKIYAGSSLTAQPGAQADLADAMAFWEGKAGKKLFDFKGQTTQSQPYTGTPSNPGTILSNVVLFQNPWPYAQNIAGMTTVDWSSSEIQGAVVMINGGIAMCPGDCLGAGAGATSLRRAITHELGHFLGLQHAQDTSNIMYPELQPGSSLDTVTIDQASLASLTAGR